MDGVVVILARLVEGDPAWRWLLWAVKGSVLLLLLFGVAAALRGASASTRHLVWSVGLLVVLAVPLVSEAFEWRIPVPAWLPAAAVQTSPAAAREAETSPVAPARDSDATMSAAELDGVASVPGLEPVVPVAAADPAPATPGAIPETSGSADLGLEATSAAGPRRAAVLLPVGVWAGIALVLLMPLAAGARRVRRLVRRGAALTAPEWTRPLYEAADRLGLAAAPRLLMNADAAMPLTCGVLRPAILLPEAAAEWSDERRRAVLSHELAHIRRRDVAMHLAARVVCALYWFQPLAWSAARRLRAESERACDDLVLHTGTRASSYADHLLQIVCAARTSRAPAVALPLAQEREFERRLLSILSPSVRRDPLSPGRKLAVAGLVLALSLPLASLTPAPAQAGPPSLDAQAGDVEPVVGAQPPSAAAADDPGPDPSLGDAAAAASPSAPGGDRIERQTPVHTSEPGSAPANPTGASEIDDAAAELARSASTSRDATTASRGAAPQDPRVIAGLLHALQDSVPQVRRTAAWGLHQYRDTTVVTALSGTLLRDESPAVREMAGWALGQIGSKAAVRPLAAALLEDGNGDVRRIAAWSLAQIGGRDGASAWSHALLQDESPRVRMISAWALGQMGGRDAETPLAGALADPDEDVRHMAAWGLGQSGLRTAPDPLIAALRDDSHKVRKVAAWSLGQIGDAAAAPAIQQALADSDGDVRRTAIWAIGRMSGDAAIDALTALLADPDPDTRAAAAAALGGRGSRPWPWPWPWPMPRPNP